jgi:hypothetical protein
MLSQPGQLTWVIFRGQQEEAKEKGARVPVPKHPPPPDFRISFNPSASPSLWGPVYGLTHDLGGCGCSDDDG